MPARSITVFITTSTREEATLISRALVEARLAACVNILPEITSVYRWEGEIQEDAETAMLAKTTEDLFPAISERVRELHSYDCPCIVAWPIAVGSADYLQWITRETRSANPKGLG